MNYLKVFALILLLGACRSNYALLQESSPVYAKVKKRNINKIAFLKPKETSLASIQLENKRKIEHAPMSFPEIKVEKPQVLISKFTEPVVENKFVGPEPKDKEKEKRKKKRKRNRFWLQMGSNLLIGVVFLGVAVVMAFIQLPSLTLLFGLASILFLIFGLKKVFKKRKRKSRNPFNKKK